MATTTQLPAEVAKHYQLVNYKGSTKQFWGKFGSIDISRLTLQQANALYQRGWTKLKKIDPAPQAKTDKKNDK